MKISIPLEDNKLCPHFGHCKHFAILETDDAGNIMSEDSVDAPPHEPGSLPKWIADQGINLVIAGGIGAHAINLLKEKGIQIIIGAPVDTPRNLAQAYLDGDLSSGNNSCDH